MVSFAMRHQEVVTDLRKRHTESMARKDVLLMQSDELVQGFQDMSKNFSMRCMTQGH